MSDGFDKWWSERIEEAEDLGLSTLDVVREAFELGEESGKFAANEAINTPQTENFISAVQNEMAHQTGLWTNGHDEVKTPTDWLWLLGYLISKAVNKPEKRLHHIITAAAALGKWHALVKLGEGE